MAPACVRWLPAVVPETNSRWDPPRHPLRMSAAMTSQWAGGPGPWLAGIPLHAARDKALQKFSGSGTGKGQINGPLKPPSAHLSIPRSLRVD